MPPTFETKAKKHANGTLSYWQNNKHWVHTLWVEQLEQPQQIRGVRKQSMYTAHWYPKSYAPGDLAVTVRCASQRDLQHLANFVRKHHRLLLETPGLRFSNRANSTGRRHLMFLRISSEAIAVRGWISSFTITKKGVFDPAPQLSFSFFTALDPYSSDPLVSHQIREWFNPAKMKPVDDPFAIDPIKGKPGREELPIDPDGDGRRGGV